MAPKGDAVTEPRCPECGRELTRTGALLDCEPCHLSFWDTSLSPPPIDLTGTDPTYWPSVIEEHREDEGS